VWVHYGKLSIKFPFSRHHKSLDFAVSDTAFLSSSKLDLTALSWVHRNK
jgi:hypothetical protein